jgi:hypothetical protein
MEDQRDAQAARAKAAEPAPAKPTPVSTDNGTAAPVEPTDADHTIEHTTPRSASGV